MKTKDRLIAGILFLLPVVLVIGSIGGITVSAVNEKTRDLNEERDYRAKLRTTHNVIVPSYVTLDCMNGWLFSTARGSAMYIYDENFQPIRCNADE
jgi:hypothetical protein